jgi:hypothetical protein
MWPLALLAGVLLLIFGVALAVRLATPTISDEEVRDRIWAVLQRESPRSFMVTGALDITATARVENTRRVLPGLVGLSLGTTSAYVRVPGRVSYGFDVRTLDPSLIDVSDEVIQVTIPKLSVYSVEPNLADMEVETERGWARVGTTTTLVQKRAFEIAQGALEGQGQLHLTRSTQPRLHTADALQRMLTPVVQAAGIPSPRFRFLIANGLVLEPPGTGGSRD